MMVAAGGSPATRGGEAQSTRTLTAAASLSSVDDRSFEQKFGERCPFCGRTWGDPTTCDTEPKVDIRTMLRSLFAGNHRPAETDPQILADRANRSRTLNTERVRRHRERNQVTLTCEWCSESFATHKREQRFCSRSHMMRARHAREELAA